MTMARGIRGVLVIGVMSVLAACSGSPTGPGPSQVPSDGGLAGRWGGTTSGAGFTGARATLELTSTGTGVSGVITARLGTRELASARITGTAIGATALLGNDGEVLDCGGGRIIRSSNVITLILSGSQLSGSYSYFTCQSVVAGDVRLTRQ